jgi:hypothetical protein
MNAGYTVKLTRTSDGTELFTCPVTPCRKSVISIYPTLLSVAETIKINTETAGSAVIYSLSGVRVNEKDLQTGTNSIQAPQLPGSYVLRITTRDNEITRQLITVK